jgi:serine/threonine-protein kinase
VSSQNPDDLGEQPFVPVDLPTEETGGPAQGVTSPAAGPTQALTDTGQQPTQPLPAGTAPFAGDSLLSIKQQLVDLELVTEKEWQTAAATAGACDNALEILRRLEVMPTSLYRDADSNPTVLTTYQVKQIVNDRAKYLRLAHYVIRDQLGAGGMGEVLKAWNTVLRRTEAIKRMVLHSPAWSLAGAPIAQKRFEQEARVLAQLHQPTITTIYHAGFEQDCAFIAMEYVPGKTLRQLVQEANREEKPLEIPWIAQQALAIAQALQHAHERGVIHRDVKPGNIMISDRGELKVLDMGLARLLQPEVETESQSHLTRETPRMGTPEVMPPEQWADAHAVTPASDLYSLGCTLYFMLTGQMPFRGSDNRALMAAHLMEKPRPPSELRPGIPKELDEIVLKLLAKRQNERYTSADLLIRDLFPLTPTQKALTESSSRRLRAQRIAIGVGVLVIGAALWLASTFGPRPVEEQSKSGSTPQLTERERLRIHAETWLAEHQRANSAVWTDLQSLIDFVGHPGLLDRLENAEQLGTLQNDVTERTKQLWYERAQAELARWRHEFGDVWPDDSLAEFVRTRLPLTAIDNDESLAQLRPLIDAESWRRRFEGWLQNHRSKYALVWPDATELRDFARLQSGGPVGDKQAFERHRAGIEDKTRTVLRNLAAQFQSTFAGTDAEALASLDKLLGASRSVTGAQSDVLADDVYKPFAQSCENTIQSLAQIFSGPPLPAGDVTSDTVEARVFLHMYGWLLGVGAAEKQRHERLLNVQVLVDGKNVTHVPVGKAFSLTARSEKPGYITILVFGSDDDQNLFLYTEHVPPQKTVTLLPKVEPNPEQKGSADRIVVYLTDRNPIDDLPPELKKAPWKTFHSNRVLFRTPQQLQKLRSLFQSETLFGSLMDDIWTGTPTPLVRSNGTVGYWDVVSFAIHVKR